ncbi:hypothetical protein LZ575_07380 [Antarcticibacterium sp. 1MA-6-2]|nr:hypothetical protein [Antarcticibacterium sp. 1MA-6-2]UJH92342.1 hypothetical protein LZ575_07380 [Antarcticibacterium sp. 1MA-6-2]
MGQNLGARKFRRAEFSVWLTARYNVIFLGVITFLYFFFGKTLAGWFST